MKIIYSLLVPLFILSGCKSNGIDTSVSDVDSSSPNRPNLILIVADDLGFGDVGAFGSEISTPNLDALAAEGASLTAFHSLPTCSPTRSVLLTGVDNHLNGMGTMAEDRLPHHEGHPGYVGHLNNEVVTVARLLQDSGYHTYMSGKWHLGFDSHLNPHARGFEHTFALLNGTANHYNDDGPNSAQPVATYSRDGVKTERPKGYSSDLFTDEMIQLIAGDEEDDKPFFAYLSFTAPHWPLQAPKQTIEKYLAKYEAGWDAIRAERFANLKQLGLVPESLKLPPRVADAPAWQTLSAKERRNEAKKMAIYAAMVDTLDANVGRLIQYLKDQGQYDNSVIIFMSDNGADPYDRTLRAIYRDFFADKGYDNSYENMGAGNSYTFTGPGWAQASSVHHSHYKMLLTEGGTLGPTFMRIPGIWDKGETQSAYASVADITPTLLELAGVEHPGREYQGRKIHTPRGRSMLPYMQGQADKIYGDDEAVAFELFGHASVVMGPWKAVSIRAPWSDSSWKLYNLKNDPGEQVDLSKAEPQRLTALLNAYAKYKTENKVIDEPDGITAYPNRPSYIQIEF